MDPIPSTCKPIATRLLRLPTIRQPAPAVRRCFHNTLTLLTSLMALACALGTGAASPTSTYRLDCPVACACETTDDATLSSINCSSQGLDLTALPVVPVGGAAPDNTTASTPVDDEGLNGTANTRSVVLSALTFVDLSNNSLGSPALTMSGQPGAQVHVTAVSLDLSHNVLDGLLADSFSDYTGLRSLHLDHNRLQNISNGAFRGLEDLTRLDLSHNLVSEVGSSAFAPLISLQVLDLSHNKITVLDSLHALSSLRYLHLQHNNIRPVSGTRAALLPPLSDLIHLDMSNNRLETTAAGMFQTLPHLESLDLSTCSLTRLDSHFLQGLTHLQDLNLDHNNLTAISYPVFQNTSLTSLSVSAMPDLLNISHDAFMGLTQLRWVNLSHNQALAFLHPHLLAPLGQLRVVDFSHCAIPLLSNITFHYSLDIERVYLGSNPLACSCVNAWLAGEAAKGNSSFVQDVTRLTCLNTTSGQPDFLTPDSFQCSEISLHNSSTRVSVHLGGQLMLRCGHDSDQPGMVKWTMPSGRTFHQHHFHPEASSHLLTPQDVKPGAPYHAGHYWHDSSSYYPQLSDREDRVMMLADGSLYIDYMLRSDTGIYHCQVSNARHNQSTAVKLYLDYKISGEVKIYGIIVGLLCALTFFTLNIIYVIISWTARRLVNKRRREIIRQMLENMNTYKSAQIARIHENYTHQLGRVRNQYHSQCDRLHRNYTQQVAKMKRGCSNQVERVRDNYTSRLAQLRDYSSNQVVQIRERANNQIIRIRDYGTAQLERLRETYKLQHLHVMKLLDTMNLDNCRHIVETECMRTESMMFDVDLLGDDIRTDSPTSGEGSEYTTPDTSPSQSLEDKPTSALSEDMADKGLQRKKILHPAQHSPILLEMQTTLDMEAGLAVDVTDQWQYTSPTEEEHPSSPHKYLMNMYIKGTNESLLQLQTEPQAYDDESGWREKVKEGFPLPVLNMERESDVADRDSQHGPFRSEKDWGSPYMTPQASPTKTLGKLTLGDEGEDSETDL